MMNVPFHKPYFDVQEIEAVTRTLKRNLIGMGPMVSSFEKEFGSYIGAAHAIAVNSCTAALHLALEALGIGEGDEVITTPLTFSATVLAIMYTGATPVLADIDPVSLCIDPEAIRRRITPRTKAVLPVHYGGYPCNLDEIYEICRRHRLALIEDAAHALPSRWRGRLIGGNPGGIRGAVCFSFHATKTLSIGDGGMITTDDPETAEMIYAKRLFGMRKNKDASSETDMALQFGVEVFGYKYNMTDIEAAIGKVQLKKADEMNRLRAAVAEKYRQRLAELPEIILPYPPEKGETSWHLFVIKAKGGKSVRDSLLIYLGGKGVKASVHFIPMYRFPFFKGIFPGAGEYLPNVENVADSLLSLPMYPGLTDEEIDYVCGCVKDFFRQDIE